MREEGQVLIGELARRTGLAVSAVRYYEQVGILASTGRRAGQRVFAVNAVLRLRAVMLAQRTGFTLAEIRVLLGEQDTEEHGAQDFIVLVTAKLADVQRRRSELDAAERMLTASLRAGACDLEICALAALPGEDPSPPAPGDHGVGDAPTQPGDRT